MRGPLGLHTDDRFQSRPILILHSGRLKNLNHVLGALVKWGIANDEFDFSIMGVDEIFDAGVESPACFAGWIEKFNDRDLGARRAENRRMHSNELARRGVCRLILA